ncbi:MAG: hypothetical protein CMO44_10925, partial [Verrucomicrobiales bacterium]|nr:hypothetical protein [Verrucomicrobiales bacterium]
MHFVTLFFSLLLIPSSKASQHCTGLEYIHYDKSCCENQAQYSDPDRHCLDSVPQLEYDSVLSNLNSTLLSMSACNSENTCSEGIDFLEIVKQAENLHTITQGGATLAEGYSDHLQAQHANLDKISLSEMPDLDLKTSTLTFEAGSNIDISPTATFEFPNIQFTGNPSILGHITVSEIEAGVDFNDHLLSNANFDSGTLRLNHAEVLASAAELNVLQNVSVSTQELSKIKGLDSSTQELNQMHNTGVDASHAKSIANIPTVYTTSHTTKFAGSTAASVAEGKTACSADLACVGVSEFYSTPATFQNIPNKIMPGTLGNPVDMPNSHISDCLSLITADVVAILVEQSSTPWNCKAIVNGNHDQSTWTDSLSHVTYLRNSEVAYGTAVSGTPIVSHVKSVGVSAPEKVVTADYNGNVKMSANVTIEGDLDVAVGEIHIAGVALSVSGLDLNAAGQLKKDLTASAQEISTLNSVLSSAAELNAMTNFAGTTASLDRTSLSSVGVAEAGKVVTSDPINGKVRLQDIEAVLVDANSLLIGTECSNIDTCGTCTSHTSKDTQYTCGNCSISSLSRDECKVIITSIDNGGRHSCSIDIDNSLYCWGWNGYGQVGDGTQTQRNTPTAVQMPSGKTAKQVSLGYGHVCAIMNDDSLYCWGHNMKGQIGDASNSNRNIPKAVQMPSGKTAKQVAAGGEHNCAFMNDDSLYCWGYNGHGQLGDGTTNHRSIPTAIQMPNGKTATQVTVGRWHTCVRMHDGSLYCWGYNGYGQLGDGTTISRYTPRAVQMPSGKTVKQVVGGYHHTCAIMNDDSLYCWGHRVGTSTDDNKNTPFLLTMPVNKTTKQVALGEEHTCAIMNDDSLYCWGKNNYGQLGDGTTTDRTTPTAVQMPSGTVKQLSLGNRVTCIIMDDDSLYCWGKNNDGQVGDGTTTDRTTPTAVLLTGPVWTPGTWVGYAHVFEAVTAENINKISGVDNNLNLDQTFLKTAADGSITINADLSVQALNVAELDINGPLTVDANTLSVLSGLELSTAQLSTLKDIPNTINFDLVNGLASSTAELNYADLSGPVGSSEASKLVTSDASNKVTLQDFKANTLSTGFQYVQDASADFDPKMTLEDCQATTIGTFVGTIDSDQHPKGCSVGTGLRFYNTHASGSGTCAGIFTCIKKEAVPGAFKVNGQNMPSADVLNHIAIDLQSSVSQLNYWQSLDVALDASHLNPMLGLLADKTDLDRLNIAQEGIVEANKILTMDSSNNIQNANDDQMIFEQSIETQSLKVGELIIPTAINKLTGVLSTVDLNRVTGTLGTSQANKAVTSDANGKTTLASIDVADTTTATVQLNSNTITATGTDTGTAIAKQKTLPTATVLNRIKDFSGDGNELNKLTGVLGTVDLNRVTGTLGTSQANKAVTTDANGKTIMANDVQVDGDVLVGSAGSARIGLGGSDITVSAVQLDGALRMHKNLTISIQEANTLDNIQANVNELNLMHTLESSTAELNLLHTTPGTTEAEKAVVYSADKIAIPLLDTTTMDATTLKLNGIAVTSTAGKLNLAAHVNTSHLNKLTGLNVTTNVLNTWADTTASVTELNKMQGLQAEAADLSILKDVLSTAQELNAIATDSTAAQLNALATTSTALELNAAVLLAANDGSVTVGNLSLGTINLAGSLAGSVLNVTAAQINNHAADLGTALASDIKDSTPTEINAIDKLDQASTAAYTKLNQISSTATALNTYAAVSRAVYADNNSSDFCDNKLPGTFVNSGSALYICLGDECAE